MQKNTVDIEKEAIMALWLIYSLVALCLWGLWGFLGKFASRSISSYNLLLLGSLGALIMFPVYLSLFSKHLKFIWNNPAYYAAFFGGVSSAIAAFFFYLAVSKGEASRVVAITATYPVVTFVLASIFLEERLTIEKSAGVLSSIIGIYLLSK